MDSVGGRDYGADDANNDPDCVIEAPPPVFDRDERRMQVRAYNYWAGMLGKRRFPAPDRLIAGDFPEFSSHAVLLHFADGIDDPTVCALGTALAAECEKTAAIARLSEVPGRSVLSRITDHYLQIIANEAPIGFEAEFVNARSATILYRGILLPFSTDDVKIDYIYGVINWKELADQRTTDELMREVGEALAVVPATRHRAPIMRPAPRDTVAQGWADGPYVPPGEPAALPLDLAPFVDHGADFAAQDRPRCLNEWLETARACALRATASEDRTRHTLYTAIARAWDFALAAGAEPDEFARLVAQAGLVLQTRAPLIPLVKLVFGADYDKTRLTEYATVLAHARRIAVAQGGLAELLAQTPGGIKAIVARERAARRGTDRTPTGRMAWQARARALPARPLGELASDGAEFALVLVRRLPGCEPAMLGEIADDAAMLAKAARHFIG